MSEEYIDDEYEPVPKLFKCAFRVIGSNSSNQQHVILEDRSYCVVALDVQDATKQIEDDHLHIEFNGNAGSSLYHVVSTKVDVMSVRCLGELMTITDKCLDIIAEAQKRPDIKPTEEDDV